MLEHTLSQSAQQLLATARALTAIEIVDEEALQPLSILVESVNTEAHLTASGAKAYEMRLLHHLCNRLRLERDFRAYPEIDDAEVKSPLVVCGMGRTGSTKMQKLLAASGDFNYLQMWQSWCPCTLSGAPHESTTERVQTAEDYLSFLYRQSPEIKLTHYMQVDQPEEESYIMEASLVSQCTYGHVRVPSYVGWVLEQGLDYSIRYVQRALKYLQWQGLADGDKPWLLKSPLYCGHEAALLNVFPDARIIMTHRDPRSTIASHISLHEALQLPYISAREIPEEMLMGLVASIESHLDYRREHGDKQFLDVHYLDVHQAPLQVVEAIYQFYEQPLSAQAAENVRAWETSNPIHDKGKHRYTLEQFGLNEGKVTAAYANYMPYLEQVRRLAP